MIVRLNKIADTMLQLRRNYFSILLKKDREFYLTAVTVHAAFMESDLHRIVGFF